MARQDMTAEKSSASVERAEALRQVRRCDALERAAITAIGFSSPVSLAAPHLPFRIPARLRPPRAALDAADARRSSPMPSERWRAARTWARRRDIDDDEPDGR